jgi:uncharacterized protein
MPEEAPPPQRQLIVSLAIFVEGGLIVLALGLGWLLGSSPLGDFKWSWRDVGYGVAAALPLLLLAALMLRWPIGPLRHIKQFSEQVLCPLLAPFSVMDMLGISLLAGLGEEMLFRGVLQSAFSRWMGPLLALALASALFGLLHAVTLTYAIMAALMGAYLGWLWNQTGNLLVPAITHALYDFVVLLYLLRGPGSEERTQLPEEPPEEDRDEQAGPSQ